jgi:Flp pilus assembly protein TadB
LSEHDPGFEQPAGEESPAGAPAPVEPTLTDDVKALLEDGKTYLEAELQFQKSRAALAADRGKSGAIYGLAAAAIAHLALIALVVGALIGLMPLIGAWGATALVVGALLIAAVVLGVAAKRRFARLLAAFADPDTRA